MAKVWCSFSSELFTAVKLFPVRSNLRLSFDDGRPEKRSGPKVPNSRGLLLTISCGLWSVADRKRNRISTKRGSATDWELRSICVDPRNFGLGIARARVYMLAWRKSKLAWTGPFDTLDEFLQCVAAKHVLTARNYFWQNLPKAQLTPAADTRQQLSFIL